MKAGATARLLVACVLLLGLARSAFAHFSAGESTGLLAGLSHPVSGMDHVLAMIAVGVWGAQLGAPAIWVLPVAFPLVMAIGGLLGLLGVPLPGVEIGIAASALMLGGAILSGRRPPLVVAAVLVSFFAIFHGHAHGTELPPGQSGLLYSLGFVVATGCLHAVGILVGVLQRWPAGRMALRAAGGAIGVAGLLFMRQALQ